MTPIQQQRLIGAGLLVLLVAVLAYVVLSKVGQHESQQQLALPEPIEFSSVIEPLEDDSVETLQDNSEALVDADLQQTTASDNTVVADNDAENTEAAPTSESTTETEAATTETSEAETPPSAQPMDRPAAQAETAAPEAGSENSDNPTVVSEPNAGNTAAGDRWLIQLGSFSVQKNAQDLKTKLEKLGYKPYVENSNTDQGTVYRVRLPSVADRQQADDTAARIQKELAIKAQVMKQ